MRQGCDQVPSGGCVASWRGSGQHGGGELPTKSRPGGENARAG